MICLQVKNDLQGQTLAGLINNAGIANHAVLMYQPIDEFRNVLEINLVGTLAVTQATGCNILTVHDHIRYDHQAFPHGGSPRLPAHWLKLLM